MNSYRVASFNAENLLHPGVFYAGRPDAAPFDEALFERKVSWIASVLDAGRVDLVGFQEVFSFDAVSAALSRSQHLADAHVVAPGIQAGENIRLRADGKLEATGPNLALASRFKILEAAAISEFPSSVELTIPLERGGLVAEVARVDIDRFERPILKARVLLPGEHPATVLVAHLKSKRPKFLKDEDQRDPVVQALGRVRSLVVRALEAAALRAIIVGLLDNTDGERGEPLILLGDLNDDLNAVTTQAIAGEEPPRFLRDEQKLREWDVLLYSVHDLQEALSYRDVSYTHIYNGRYELLDHIFVSQEFVRQFPKRIAQVAHTRIFNDHIFDERWSAERDAPAVIVDGKRLSLPGARSDHGVPVTEFESVQLPPSLGMLHVPSRT